jgi:hypothetical protein
VRRFTLVAVIVLFGLIVGAAVYQIALASRDRAPYPGPAEGTPFPTFDPPS